VNKELLSKGVEEDRCETLWSIVQLKDSPIALLEKFKNNKKLITSSKDKEALEDMSILFEYLEILKVNDHMFFDFSLARGLDYYTDLIYEAVLTETDKVGSISGGGRYDNRVGIFSKKTSLSVVSIGIERVLNILEENLKVKRINEYFIII